MYDSVVLKEDGGGITSYQCKLFITWADDVARWTEMRGKKYMCVGIIETVTPCNHVTAFVFECGTRREPHGFPLMDNSK